MELFKLFGSVFLEDQEAIKGLDRVDERAAKSGNKLSKLGNLAMGAGKLMASGMAIAGAAAIGGSVALFKLGETFEESYNKIRIGTGATGKALDGLKKDFKNVYTDTSASIEDVSTAIADLNTRTGLAGKPLQGLASQMIKLSQISGEELSPLIQKTTRIFGDWTISSSKQAETLDYLFKVSQSTGISVSSLSEKMVKFGGPLRQIGFDFEKSAALMGKWEKEGVNTELVLSSLRIALGKMAKGGIKDTNAELEKIIKNIKNAGSVGDATKIALEKFGARAGPDMAAAIREGRFELDDLIKSLENSSETIDKAKKDTETFSEKLEKIKHKAAVVFEPLGTGILNLVNKLLPMFEKAINKIDFEKLNEKITKVVNKMTEFGEFMQDKEFSDIGKSLLNLIPDNVIQKITEFEEFMKEFLTPIGKMFKETFEGIDWSVVIESFNSLKESIKPIIKPLLIFSGILTAFSFAPIIGAINGIIKSLGYFIAVIMDVGEIVSNILGLIVGIFTLDGELIIDSLKRIVENGLSLFSNLGNGLLALVSGFIKGIIIWFRTLFDTLIGHSIVPDIVNGIIEWFKKLPNKVINLIISLKNGIVEKFNFIKNFIKDVFIKIKNYMINPFKSAGKIIENIINTITDTFKGMINNAITSLNILIAGINKINFKVPSWIPIMGGKSFKINVPEIPKLAKGGMIETPGNVLVGENGPEILTLNKGAKVTPLNENGTSVVFDRRAFEGAIIFDDYGIDRLIDRIAYRLKSKGVVPR